MMSVCLQCTRVPVINCMIFTIGLTIADVCCVSRTSQTVRYSGSMAVS